MILNKFMLNTAPLYTEENINMLMNNEGFVAALIMFLIVSFLISIAMYIYLSIVFMKIGKKGKYPYPGIAWIPGIGPALISAKLAKMHWWPIFFLVGSIIPFIGIIFALVFGVFSMIWAWKMLERFGKPGWLVLLGLIPIIGGIIQFVVLGMIAWGDCSYSDK